MRTLFLFLAIGLVGCGDDAPDPAPQLPEVAPTSARQTAADVAATAPRLSTFASLVEEAGLREALGDTARVLTVFAPENAAFADADLDALRADPEALRALLLSHVLETRMFSGDVFGEITIETLGGADVTLDASDAGVVVQRGGTTAVVTEADLDGDNGVVHIIDAVLPAPTGS